MRGKRRTMGRKLACVMAGSVVAIGFAVAKPGVAGAVVSPYVCDGLAGPATIPAGTYSSGLIVEGLCSVSAGSITVSGLAAPGATLEVTPNSALVAAFNGDFVSVDGNLVVQTGGTLIMGCEDPAFTCIDNSTGSSGGFVTGNVTALYALGVIVHDSEILGNVSENHGGGGAAGIACQSPGVFGFFGAPVYSDFEDNDIGGSLSVTNLTTCWSGVLRNEVGFDSAPHVGGITFSGNHDGDPDGNEVLQNVVINSIVCKANIPAVQFGDSGADPNHYFYGPAVGQCAYPISESVI
jgi:hypothetical protein